MSKKKIWKAKLLDGFHPVMIDMDVYKAIEAARRDFGEMPNAILRRLLRIDGHASAEAGPARRSKGGGAAPGGWSKIDRRGHSVFLPDGTQLRAAYAGQTVDGTIADGTWRIGEASYNSPSAALIAQVRTRDGRAVNVNGWRHWEVKLPGAQTWRPLADL